MIRPLRRAAWAGFAQCFASSAALCLVLPATAAAQSPPVASKRPDLAVSWRTTTSVEPAALQRTVLHKATRPIATSALPTVTAPKPAASLTGTGHTLSGTASYYWQDQKTATGEVFDKMAMTAAHKTLPFGTSVRVTHLGNGRSVIVRINDRGPFKPGRVIDLSYAAAGAIDMRDKGLAPVRLDVLK